MSEIEEREVRITRLKELYELGSNPYPSTVERTHSCHEARILFDQLEMSNNELSLVGRIRNLRRHGGSAFITIEDGTDRFQLYIKKDECGDNCFHVVKNLCDIGDFVKAHGTLFTTKTGEKTLHARSFGIIAKSILPLPEQWHGLSDVEMRYRQRYLDLISNPEVKDIFMKRSKIVKTLRNYFEENGFLEVETPILQAVAGGAAARPFVTHHNSLNADMFLRVAPELHLKRLIIGGFERVYEFARCFRNEGIDHAHNPEFTQIEAYVAYADYEFLMGFVEKMLYGVVHALSESDSIEHKGVQLSFQTPFMRLTFRDALLKFAHIDIDQHADLGDLRREAQDRGIDGVLTMSRAAILDELFKLFVRKNLQQPTFVTDYPVELSPLAKKKASEPRYTERFQLVIAGMEVVNAFSELNDPIDQEERFQQQQKNKEMGDTEAHGVDDEFVTALEYGMPPTAGLGMGIDRLTALLTNSHSLKEVILFPTLRPKKSYNNQQEDEKKTENE